MATTWTIIGQLLTLVGAGIGAWGMVLSPKQAVEIAATRWMGSTFEENLKFPGPQNLLWQSKLTAVGFGVIAVGTAAQIIGTWLV
jgi:hypothetical protein